MQLLGEAAAAVEQPPAVLALSACLGRLSIVIVFPATHVRAMTADVKTPRFELLKVKPGGVLQRRLNSEVSRKEDEYCCSVRLYFPPKARLHACTHAHIWH